MNHCVPEWDVTGGDLDVVVHSADLFSPNKAKWETTQQRRFNSSAMASVPDDDFEELCWENGQLLVVMQGQNGRAQKQRHCPVSPCANFSTVPEIEGAVPASRLGASEKDGTLEAMVHDVVGVTDSSAGNTYMQEDEMVSWIQYPLDEPLEKYHTELLTDVPNPNSTHIWKNREGREATVYGQKKHTPSTGSVVRSNHEKALRNTCDSFFKPVPADFTTPVSSSRAPGLTSPPSSLSCGTRSSSIQSEVPFKQPMGVFSFSSKNFSSATSSVTLSKSIPASGPAVASCQMPPPKIQSGTLSNHSPLLHGRSGLMNFSHFSRPAATFKANLHATGMASGPTETERLKQLDRVAVEACMSTDSSIESTTASISGTCRDGNPLSVAPGVHQSLGTTSMWQPLQTLLSRKEADSVSCANDHVHDGVNVGEPSNVWNPCSTSNMPLGIDKGAVVEALEPTRTCSSGGLGNSAVKSGKIASGPEKRKVRDVEDSECQSDDPEDELGDVNKSPPLKSTSVKRSRAAEIHNLSERRRRDRINEKMKALQELIPNSNKTDKASLLEEVIEYLKMLQSQLQVMSFRSGMSISPMLMPPGMQMAQLSAVPHMGMGMGMGLGMMDMTAAAALGRHVIPLPSFPGSVIPGSAIPTIPGSTIPPTPSSTVPGSAVSDQPLHFLPSNFMDYKAYIAHQQLQQKLQVPSQPFNTNMYNTLMIHQHPRQPLANYSRANPPPQ